MDFVFLYFIPSLSVIFLLLIPFFLLRVVKFITRTHFVSEVYSLYFALISHLIVFSIYLIGLLVFAEFKTSQFYTLLSLSLLLFLILLFVYRYRFNHLKRHLYVVLFSKWNNKESFDTYLREKGHKLVDFSGSSYNFVTSIKFNHLKDSELKDLMSELSKTDLFYSFSSVKGLGLLGLNSFLLFGGITGFALFFAYLPNLI